MSRCELTGKRPVIKNKVSHSNIKTKSTALPNVQNKRLYSKVLNQFVRLKVATSAIRDMEHSGGFDSYLLNQDADLLSARALKAKSMILNKMKAKKAVTAKAATTETAAPAKKATAKKTAAKK